MNVATTEPPMFMDLSSQYELGDMEIGVDESDEAQQSADDEYDAYAGPTVKRSEANVNILSFWEVGRIPSAMDQ